MKLEENKQIFYQFYNRAWNKGDVTVVDELLAPNFVNHELEGMIITQSHRELYKQGIIETFKAFPDWTMTFVDMIAEKDKVVLQWEADGTHTGEGMGEPTRHQFQYVGISIARIVDGKITDFWKKDNSFQVWQQHLRSSIEE